MICFMALIIFAILAVFSAKYRAYFKEALDCVARKATLRKCTTSFDKKMKIKVTSKLSKRNKSLGKFVYKNFDIITWTITIVSIIIMILSLYFGVLGVYNWYAYGNCNGPDSTELCVYNALTGIEQPNTNISTIMDTCGANGDCASDCNAPDYHACDGDCNCIKTTCEI